MPRKLDGSYIQTGSITTTQLSSAVTTQISAGGGPRVTTLVYPGDDTAANTVGGQTVYINGSGFETNNAIYINGNAVPSKSFISASNLSFTTPALSAGLYPIYVINTDTGATAIFVPGISISAEPAWVTSAGSLSGSQDEGSAWSYSLSASGDAPITYALAAGSSLPGGVSLAANGLISGTISSPTGNVTTYTFSVVATDAQNQDSTRQFTVTTSTGEGALFANNVLLIHADGTNNKNNHTFLDSSNNNFTITRNGNATQGSFSPFSQTGWSNYFDGTGDYLTTPSSGQFAPTGDFTISMWFYPTSFAASYYVLAGSWNAGASDEWLIQYDNTGAIRFLTSTDSTFSAANVVKLNQWNFLSVSRSGSTVTGYMNGSSFRSYTLTGTVGSASKTIYIGIQANGSSWPYIGYISNLRLVSGSAQSATPPTSASTAISGTSLLTCQSNRFIDNSTNAFTLTRAGDVSVQTFSPFAPTAEYSTANVGGSGYFDGSGDYLMLPNSSSNTATDLGISQRPFTLEWWTYFTTTTSGQYIISKGGGFGGWNGTNGWQYILSIELSSNCISLGYYNGSSYTYWQPSFTPSAILLGRWAHMAMSYDGTNLSFYINGSRIGTTTATNFSKPSASDKCCIGSTYGVASEAYYYNGYVSDLRIVNGTAVYNPTLTTLTVPTAPLTNIANTSLLLNFTNAGIYDQTGKVVMETFGDAKVSTAQYKYGTGSISFDGTGDYIETKSSELLRFGSGDFTIECWVRFNTIDTQTTVMRTDSGSGTNGILFGHQSGMACYATSAGSSWDILTGQSLGSPSTGIWYHMALTRSGNTWRGFWNGNVSFTVTNSSSLYQASPVIRIGGANPNDYLMNGYIDDLRITKGYSRYTASFTPPTAALKDK